MPMGLRVLSMFSAMNDSHNVYPDGIHRETYELNSSVKVSQGVTELHCLPGDLLGPLGLFVQGLLAVLAFTSLIGLC